MKCLNCQNQVEFIECALCGKCAKEVYDDILNNELNEELELEDKIRIGYIEGTFYDKMGNWYD